MIGHLTDMLSTLELGTTVFPAICSILGLDF